MLETVKTAADLALEHPLLGLSSVLFVVFPLVLGWMHEGRIVADCSIPLIRHFKRECREWRKTGRRLKDELKSK